MIQTDFQISWENSLWNLICAWDLGCLEARLGEVELPLLQRDVTQRLPLRRHGLGIRVRADDVRRHVQLPELQSKLEPTPSCSWTGS